MRSNIALYLFGAIAVVSAACAPAPRAAGGPSAAPGQESRAPKALTIAIQTELKGFVREYSGETAGIGGVSNPPPIVHNWLSIDNGMGVWLPQLAVELPPSRKEHGLFIPTGGWRPSGSSTRM